MKITTARFRTVSPIAPYGINDVFELEGEIEEGEDQRIARKELVKEVREWAKESDPKNIVPEPVTRKEINIQDEKIEIAIENAKSIEELNTLNKGLPVHLLTAFTKKLTELKK